MGFLDDLKNKILIADGAMGTILYSEGQNTCPEEYNLTHPEKIERIHRSYIENGANVIQTNTYGANYEKLKVFGLEHEVKRIHISAVEIAKRAAEGKAYILGTVGGFRTNKKEDYSLESILYHSDIQIESLVNNRVDAILFETYYDFEELVHVIRHTRENYDIPIVAQLTAPNTKTLYNGYLINDALKELVSAGADIVGLNCHHGPHHMKETFKHIELPDGAFLSCYPNSSLLDFQDDEFQYSENASYFGNIAETLVQEGIRLIGGCCGTTPEHIKQIHEHVHDAVPIKDKKVIPYETIKSAAKEKTTSLKDLVNSRKTVIVELDTPKHLETDKFFKGIDALVDSDVDAVTIADNSLAQARISNIVAAGMIKQKYDLRVLAHIACRDRNLIGLQSDLMGLALLGVNDILAITGDPSKIGHFPGATSVYDVNSKGLTKVIKQFNDGMNMNGESLKVPTDFTVAGALNSNAKRLDAVVKQLHKKKEAGTDYFITQPIFDSSRVKEIYEATRELDMPIFIGVMPITSYNNAAFIHNEIPGIKLSDELLNAFYEVKDDKEATKALTLKYCRELVNEVYKYFNGLYIITPFLRYDLSIYLVDYAKSIENSLSKKGEII